MKKNILMVSIAVLGLSAATFLWAGKNDACHVDPGAKVDARVEHMSKKLKLTDDQKAKVKQILTAQSPKMDEAHQQMMEANQNAGKEIEAVLTPEQKQKFEKMNKKGKGACCGGKECPMGK